MGHPRNVFITGGSRGLGKGMALEFADAGYGVAFTYVNNRHAAEQTIDELKSKNPTGNFFFYQLDVKDSAAVETVVDQAIDDLDGIAVAVNNAGVNRDNTAAFMTDEEWREVLDTVLSGSFYVCRQFIPHFLSNRFGRIINISSIAADGTSGQVNYSAAKAGLYGMTRTIAKEYGPKGITANVVVPGFFHTDMTEQTLSPALQEYWLKFCPTRRIGKLDELTKTVLFLASEASGFINGSNLMLTGGLDYTP